MTTDRCWDTLETCALSERLALDFQILKKATGGLYFLIKSSKKLIKPLKISKKSFLIKNKQKSKFKSAPR
jgi:hypothetical protein